MNSISLVWTWQVNRCKQFTCQRHSKIPPIKPASKTSVAAMERRQKCRSWPWSTRFSRYDTMIYYDTLSQSLHQLNLSKIWQTCFKHLGFWRSFNSKWQSKACHLAVETSETWELRPTNRRGLSRTVLAEKSPSKLSALMAKLGIGGMSQSFHWTSAISIHFAAKNQLTRLLSGGPSPF